MSSKDRTTETRWGPGSPAPWELVMSRWGCLLSLLLLLCQLHLAGHAIRSSAQRSIIPGRAAPDTTPERQAAHPRLSPLASQEEICPQPQRGNCLRHEWLWESWDLPLGKANTWAMCLCSSSGKRPFLYKNTPNSFYLQLHPERDMVTTNKCLCLLHARETLKYFSGILR